MITYVSSIYDAFPKVPEGGEGISAIVSIAAGWDSGWRQLVVAGGFWGFPVAVADGWKRLLGSKELPHERDCPENYQRACRSMVFSRLCGLCHFS